MVYNSTKTFPSVTLRQTFPSDPADHTGHIEPLTPVAAVTAPWPPLLAILFMTLWQQTVRYPLMMKLQGAGVHMCRQHVLCLHLYFHVVSI